MKAIIEAQYHAYKRYREIDLQLSNDAAKGDTVEEYCTKLELRIAAEKVMEVLKLYREAERKYREVFNADNGDI